MRGIHECQPLLGEDLLREPLAGVASRVDSTPSLTRRYWIVRLPRCEGALLLPFLQLYLARHRNVLPPREERVRTNNHHLTNTSIPFITRWIYTFAIPTDSLTDQYVACFYFAVVTMTTTGYGDIYATSTTERLFMILSLSIAGGIYGYTLNSIGTTSLPSPLLNSPLP